MNKATTVLSKCLITLMWFAGLSLSGNAIAEDRERIINGVPAKLTDLPHQVSLMFADGVSFAEPGAHFCGGSLIVDNDDESWVLTAAHCLTWYDSSGQHERDLKPRDVKIVSGAVLLHDQERVEQDIEKIIFHESYDPKTSENDIALLRLRPLTQAQKKDGRAQILYRRPIDFRPNQVDLAELTRPYTGVTVSGWGLTAKGSPTNQLQKLERLPLVDNVTCNDSYNSEGITIPKSMLCAGLRSGGYDSCLGDSGGPLSAKSIIDGRMNLIGIVSWGPKDCASPKYYGVYTRVWSYLNWIDKAMQ